MPTSSEYEGDRSTSRSTSVKGVDVEVQDAALEEYDTAHAPESLSPGAPVEHKNPLGRQVTFFSAVALNLGELLGSGIFSVPGVILNSVGSVGLMLTFWLIAPILAYVALLAYTELASMFPQRSGAEVVFLEQAYPRPRFLVPVAFAVTSVLLSFSATNSIVFAQYVLHIFNVPLTEFRQTMLALSAVAFCVGVVGISTKWSLRAVNFLTSFKVLSLIFVALTGIAVMTGMTRITDPLANFHNVWQGSTTSPNALATGLVKTNYAFIGWANAFNVLNEVQGSNPVRTVRNASLASLGLVTVLFFLVNMAYIAAVPIDEIKSSGQLVGALFFKHVFGEHWASRALPVMVALSCIGNIIAVTVGQARVLREVARQGLLPYPEFFASTKPFGTPLAPVSLKCFLTVTVIMALPVKDAFNFLLDLASYPNLIFAAATAIGVWILRRRRARAGLPPSQFQVPNAALWLWLGNCMFLLIMPWIPPEHGRSDVSFWYATYCVVGLLVLLACALYYYVWIVLLPKVGGYDVVEEVVELENGARTTHLARRRRGHRNAERQPLLASNH